MNSTGQLSRLYDESRDDVQFLFVYCREAHPIDGDLPSYRTMVEDPVTTAERSELAKQFVDDFELDIPVLVDAVNDAVSKAYASHPDRLYLVGKDGRIAFAGEKGPRGFKPEELDKAILVLTRQQASRSRD